MLALSFERLCTCLTRHEAPSWIRADLKTFFLGKVENFLETVLRQFEAQSSIDTGDKRSFFGNKSKTERKAGKFVVPPLSGSCGSNGQRHRTFSFSTFWILSLLSLPGLDFSYGCVRSVISENKMTTLSNNRSIRRSWTQSLTQV